MPVIGADLVRLVRGGSELGAVALARFYAVHVLVLPALVVGLLAVHLALVIYHGVSVPPGVWHRLTGRYEERYAAAKEHGPRFWPELIVADLLLASVVFLIVVGLTAFQFRYIERKVTY